MSTSASAASATAVSPTGAPEDPDFAEIHGAIASASAAPAAPAAGRAPEHRAWVFTWNNPTTNVLFPDGLSNGVQYLIYQEERAPNTGTRHLQGYIYFKNTKTRSAVSKLTYRLPSGAKFSPFAHAWLAPAVSTAEKNKAYCAKSESRVDGPWELGEMPKGTGQGSRADLNGAIDVLVATNGDFSKVDPVVYVRNFKGLTALVTDRIPPPRRDNLKVITLIGKTGVGKSHAIHELYPEISKCQWGNGGAWFPGYHGQSVMAFEEFRGQVPLQRMLQYLDKYPTHLEQKGGAFPARFTLVFVTSNSEPHEWYKNDPMHPRDEELAALYRRLDYDPIGRAHGIRYIKADDRAELKRKLAIALSIADLEPKSANADTFFGPADRAPQPAPAPAPAPAPVPPPMAAAAPRTPPLRSSSPEPLLRRQKAALNEAAVADVLIDDNGDYLVRDDILDDWHDCTYRP